MGRRFVSMYGDRSNQQQKNKQKTRILPNAPLIGVDGHKMCLTYEGANLIPAAI